MQITLGGRRWDATPFRSIEEFDILRHQRVADARRRYVYRWRCPDGPGERIGDRTPTGAVPLPNIVHFHETDPDTLIGGRDTGRSRAMQRAVLRETGLASIAALDAAVTAALPIGGKRLPLAAFAWLNPVAHYRLLVEVDFAMFEVTSTVVRTPPPNTELRFILLVPHRLGFRAHVGDYCSPAAYEELVADPAHDEDHEETFLVPAPTRLNRDLRLAVLRWREEVLTRRLDPTTSTLSPVGRERTERDRQEVRQDIRTLSEASFDD